MDLLTFDWTFLSFLTSSPGTTFLPRLILYSILIPSSLMYSMMGLLFPNSESPLGFSLLKEMFEDTDSCNYSCAFLL